MTEDAELLSQYAAEGSEAAFAELTGRHVDLVYSAALRLVNGDVHSAQDVTQQVFTEVARQAKRLVRHPALVGWLYTTTRLMALRVNRTEQRRKAREQEANTMNELLHDDTPPPDWSQVSLVIEDALHELSDKDRHAILLRFFQNKTLHEVGSGLNLTENAARMRVERALDKLRGELARRGITTAASALAIVISANAVQSAPAGFAAAISTAAIAGSTVQTSTLIAATKTIAMTTLQKTIIAATLAIAAGTGIYAVHQDSQLRGQLQTVQQERGPLTAQIQLLEQERTQATNQLAALKEENARLKSDQNATELLKLRGQVGVLRERASANEAKPTQPMNGLAKLMSDPAMKEYIQQAQVEKIRSLYADLFNELKLTPEQSDKFLQLFMDVASKGLAKYMATAQGTQDQVPGEPSNDLRTELKALLGDAGYARYKQFSEEIPARTTIKLLNNQLGENPLNSEQSARLLQVVKAEPTELTVGITGAADKAFLGSQADIDSFLQRVSESNQRIVQQAASFLTADQQDTLNNVLTKAINTRKLQAAALIQKH
ncbi:MAG TPA: sigma-70 family RNA polymerase sigma factor [Candidatus Binatia bacterium]|jgi:RNA polymerase sigma factor (sigma-70 family)|nr:sigma-70 family RNA polymerase sigma factor [Candidatus Binatia bacterium]